MEAAIKVLYLEDKPETLHPFSDVWRSLGIMVEEALNTEVAESAVFGHEAQFDVLVLDMFLEGQTKSGADFGIAVRERVGLRGPEFLIYSQFDYQEYYQKALLLGAAAYLRKTEFEDPVRIASHLRALALRRALRSSNEGVLSRLESLAWQKQDFGALVKRFARELLIPELRRVLATDFVVMFAAAGTELGLVSADGQVHPGGVGVRKIEGALTGNLSGGGRLEVGSGMFKLAQELEIEPVLRPFLVTPGSAFCMLANLGQVRLSLGLLQAGPAEPGLPVEEAAELALAIRRYLHPTVTEPLVLLLESFSRAATEARKAREVSAGFSLALAHEVSQLAAELGPLKDLGDGRVGGVIVKLQQLGDELNDSGQLLDDLSRPPGEDDREPPARAAATHSLASLVQEIWDEMREFGFAQEGWELRLTGDAIAVFRKERIRRALWRLVNWLLEWGPEPESGTSMEVTVRCAESASQVVIELESHGRRLGEFFRKKLFLPQAALVLAAEGEKPLGLYLAHELVAAEGGGLEDRSEELPGEDIGHRFGVWFRKSA